MQEHESHNVGPRSSPSDRGSSTSGFQLSTKLTHKIEKLARWRIDPASIEFPEETCEFKGGFATVSKAFLAPPPSDSEGSPGELTYSNSSRRKVSDNLSPVIDAESLSRFPTLNGQVVAVKKLKIESDRDLERVLGLTLREARFLVESSHESIIKLDGFVEDGSNGIIWLVFSWEDNGNLRDFIASQDWEIPERISLIDDVASGVEYLHSRTPPICHGDLKSVNILVNSYCRAIITDFGSARRLTNDDLGTQTKPARNEARLATQFEATFCTSTNTITLTGNKYTLRWAAPELLMDERPSPQSDMWALGWVAYEVMTSTIPFQDIQKDSVVIKCVIQGDLPSITSDARMSLIQALCSLIISCWNMDPKKRPTAEDCRKSISWMPKIVPSLRQMADTADSRAHSPDLLLGLGAMHLSQHNYPNASKFFTRALEIYTDIADSKGRASALRSVAEVHRLQDMTDEAVVFYSEALQIYIDIGDTRRKALTLCGLAAVHLVRKEYSAAIVSYSEALKMCTTTGDAGLRADALSGLAQVHQQRKEYSQAIRFYADVLQISTKTGNRFRYAAALLGLATVHHARKEHSQATIYYSDALQIFTQQGDPNGRASALWGLAEMHRTRNLSNEAIEHYTQAAELLKQCGDTKRAAGALEDAADVRRLLGLEVTA